MTSSNELKFLVLFPTVVETCPGWVSAGVQKVVEVVLEFFWLLNIWVSPLCWLIKVNKSEFVVVQKSLSGTSKFWKYLFWMD